MGGLVPPIQPSAVSTPDLIRNFGTSLDKPEDDTGNADAGGSTSSHTSR
jgi:hypothetical protein